MLGAETIFVINPTLYGSKLALRSQGLRADHRAGARQPGAARTLHPCRPTMWASSLRWPKTRPGEHQLRHLGHRLGTARQRRAAGEHGGREAPPGALPRRGAGAQRRDRRARPVALGRGQLGVAAVTQRSRQDTRHRQQDAPAAIAGCAHRRRERLAGLRGHHLVRTVHHRRTPREVVGKINARGAAADRRSGVPRALHRTVQCTKP